MKKVLFATTALVATAGVASADVTVSGYAEMGLVGGDMMETQFHQDIDVTFSLSGTTDNGLTFGASVDLDEAQDTGSCTVTETAVAGTVHTCTDAANAALDNTSDDGGVAVFISGNFGTVTMGDTDGALDWALTEAGNIGNPGSIADDETAHGGYLGSYGDGSSDGQVLRYDYSFGDFAFAISMEQDTVGGAGNGVVDAGDTNGNMALGLRYSTSAGGVDLSLGLGYQSTDFGTANDQTIIGASVVASFAGGFSAGIQYSDWSDVGGVAGADNSHMGIGIGYSMDAISLHANYGEYDSGASGFGLAAAYDLGGGAGLHLGYGSTDGGADTWSFGLAMSF
ncbi:porin [Nioella sp. MMSF_3534]|uniref:porin n=1 Tax=Nioella sp. MMSF_3534 TaxID=3046720 RepID=UPI00273F1F57|nr:porin [Nioella sp. MMSF_3534]